MSPDEIGALSRAGKKRRIWTPTEKTVTVDYGREVVERHTQADYAVAFCGFAPGFAYLDGLPHELVVPRLGSPRTLVPAGSVVAALGLASAKQTVLPPGAAL